MMPEMDRERFEQVMMAAVDGELSAEDRRAFEQVLDSNPALQAEFEQYRKLKEVTTAMKFSQPSPEVWDTYWHGVYNRLERGLAWILLSLGAVLLLTYAGYHLVLALFADTATPLIVRLGFVGLIAGMAIMLVSVVRERIFTAKHDKYKEIQR